MASSFVRNERIEKAWNWLRQPGVPTRYVRLGVVWSIEASMFPVVMMVSKFGSEPMAHKTLVAQNRIRMRMLSWACPELR